MPLTGATFMCKPFLPVLIRKGWKNVRDTFHQLRLLTVILGTIFTYLFTYWHRLPSPQVASEPELDYYHQRVTVRFPLRVAERFRTLKSQKCLEWKAIPIWLLGMNILTVVIKKENLSCFQYIIQNCTICHCSAIKLF